MKLHTKITKAQAEEALRHMRAGLTITECGSRTTGTALNFYMYYHEASYGRRHKGGGKYAATWDEWGIALAALYDLDPDMICGSAKSPAYSDEFNFHYVTQGRFAEPITDPCPAHRWDWDEDWNRMHCRKCSATQIRNFNRSTF